MLFLFVELVSLPFRAAGCSYLLSCFVQSYVLCAPFWTVVLIRSACYNIAYALCMACWYILLGWWTSVLTCRPGWCTLLDCCDHLSSWLVHPLRLWANLSNWLMYALLYANALTCVDKWCTLLRWSATCKCRWCTLLGRSSYLLHWTVTPSELLPVLTWWAG